MIQYRYGHDICLVKTFSEGMGFNRVGDADFFFVSRAFRKNAEKQREGQQQQQQQHNLINR